jgi:hypothetical protein
MYMMAFALTVHPHEHGKILVCTGDVFFLYNASFCKVIKWFGVNNSAMEICMFFSSPALYYLNRNESVHL